MAYNLQVIVAWGDKITPKVIKQLNYHVMVATLR